MSAAAPILVVDGVSRRFGGLQAVDGVSFDVPPGSITALIGPNGAGKTTLFHLLSGFVRPDSGSVHFTGHALQRLPSYRIARRGLVRTFQIPKVFERMTVLDNMLAAAPRQPKERLSAALVPRLGRESERRNRARAEELLERFLLTRLTGEYAGTLSGGQRKLLELARALMAEPKMLLLDEPMAGVNPTLGKQLLDHIVKLRDDEGMTILFIEHDMDVVMERSDRVIVMAQGSVIADDKPQVVARDPKVVDAYLGAPEEIEDEFPTAGEHPDG